MGGGLMQLVAYGAQDIYLTGNPQITFFKVVYRRHTNFSMEAIKQTFDGEFSSGGSSVDCIISRNGDLIHNMWLEIFISRPTFTLTGTDPVGESEKSYLNWTNNFGHAFLKDCEIEIGGQKIDKLYSQWLDVWNELTDKDSDLYLGLGKNSSKDGYLDSNEDDAITTTTIVDNLERRAYVHLPFWFSKNIGLALPLIALQYHEVKLKLTTRGLKSLLNTNVTDLTFTGDFPTPDVQLWVDYIYLDTDERRRFAQVSHEYLIEQLQLESKNVPTDNSRFKMNLDFNHPVKELIWVNQKNVNVVEASTYATSDATTTEGNANNDYFNYLSFETTVGTKEYVEYINGQKSIEGFSKMRLKLNGHDRFEKRNASYFRLCQPYQCGHKIPEKHIYCYSFALKPQEHQPSGTCNFSRIDDAEMVFDTVAKSSGGNTLNCYAINYNVLRIMSGMGGLAYSN